MTEHTAPAALCPSCGGEMIQYEDGPDGTLECAWCPAAPRTPAGETAESVVRRFTYVLNAMEHAAQERHPASWDYAGKRRAVLEFVRGLATPAASVQPTGAGEETLEQWINRVTLFLGMDVRFVDIERQRGLALVTTLRVELATATARSQP